MNSIGVENEKGFIRVCIGILAVIAALFLAIIVILSGFNTVVMDLEGKAVFFSEWGYKILLAVFSILLFVFIGKKVGIRISRKVYRILCFFYFFCSVGLIYVLALLPAYDQYFVTSIAAGMLEGDYSEFGPGGYICLFPNNYGFIKYIELVYYFFKDHRYYYLESLNVVYTLGIITCSVRLMKYLFGREKYGVGIMMMLFSPLLFYNTYIYGNNLSLALSLFSILFIVKMQTEENRRWLKALIGILAIVISIMIKTNAIIIMIAEIIYLIAFVIQNRKRNIAYNLITAFMMVLLYFVATKALNDDLHKYTYKEEVGSPMVAWIAMGLQSGGAAEGWYNHFNRDVYWNNNEDVEVAKTLSKQSIKESIDKFASDPLYCFHFFSRKLCSEWANPSFEAFSRMYYSVSNNPNGEHNYPERIAEFLKFSDEESLDMRHKGINFALNVYELVIYIGVLIFLFRKKLSLRNCILLLIFVGGFVFHCFWEAASQYMLPYFLMLFPYSFEGLSELAHFQQDKR